MRPAVLLLALLVPGALAGAGCGAEIGDPCIVSTDCAQNGTRSCDTNSDGGYCTIRGCDYGTCPSEAECVRFFTGSFSNRTCDPATEDLATDMCSPDELCAIDGHCVTRASEVRYCMRSCGSSSDCRTNYECRDVVLMKAHGGEPVPPTGERLGDTPPAFCAQAPLAASGSGS